MFKPRFPPREPAPSSGGSSASCPRQPQPLHSRTDPRFSLFPCGSSRAQETFMQWDQCRRFYNFLMADNMKKIILSHR